MLRNRSRFCFPPLSLSFVLFALHSCFIFCCNNNYCCQILERLCTYMYAEMSYFHQGYVMLTQLEPSLRELMGTLEQVRKKLRNATWLKKRNFRLSVVTHKQTFCLSIF